MRTYDISLTISPDMIVWPGDPKVHLERVSKMEEGADANVSKIQMGVHTGTHVDAPYHFIQDGTTVENLPLDLLVGRAYVLDLPDVELITAEVLKDSPIPPRTKRVLLKTKNSTYWATKTSFQKDFVSLSKDGAEYLTNRGVKLIGIDYLSIAPFTDSVPIHQALLGVDAIILEGLNLSEVAQGRYTLYCLPLKIKNSDGAPARAILFGV